MKLHQSIAVCLAMMAGVTADGCFAQSTTNQNVSIAVDNASQDPAIAVPRHIESDHFPWKNTRASHARASGFPDR